VPIVHVALQLDDGTWVNFSAPFVEDPASVSPRALALFALAALVILGVAAWAVRRLTSPLSTLAGAADRLGADVNAAPLAEDGARELRQAARAFNAMQARLQQFVRDRLQMTAAISHDLRTPITRMRLRAELVDDGGLRHHMLSDLAEMEALIDATLSYAREESTQEPAEVLDLLSLVEDACEGRPGVEFIEEPGDLGRRLPVTIRPLALRRALGNLIDNAIKYGERARVRVTASADRALVQVDDDGPGIPDADHARVFEPYQRLERSRNTETGGVGLGLAIARGIARAHGGDVQLANRAGGGLRATIELPRAIRSA
jgi:signal transduction histidine kinase